MNFSFAKQLNKDGETCLTNGTRDGSFPTQLVPLMASTWPVKLLLTLAQSSTECCLSISSFPLLLSTWHDELQLLTSIKNYQNVYQSDPFSSVVRSGLPQNKL